MVKNSPLKRSGVDQHSFHTANTPHLPLPVVFHQRAHTTNSDSSHPITSYYSFMEHERMKGLSWPSWLTYSGQFTHINGHPSAAGHLQASETLPVRSETDVLPLSYSASGKHRHILNIHWSGTFEN